MTEAEDIALVKKHVAALGEHYDSVQIFVTRLNGGDTIRVSSGEGNWYARFGHVTHWLELQKEAARNEAHSEEDDE